MKTKRFLLFFLFAFLQWSDFKIIPSAEAQPLIKGHLGAPPLLVLTLVYDQLRADMLTRFSRNFLPPRQKNGRLGGFRYLMEQGAYFPFAEYEVLQSMTCPGHAMILTGSYPYQNGIPLNDSFDNKNNKLIYCAEDSEFALSPRRLRGTTVGDELKMNSPESKVVALALKDRAAIMLGGHAADAVIWFNSDKMNWESSKFYENRLGLPGLKEFNETQAALLNKEISWTPKFSTASFSYTAKAQSAEALGFPFGIELTNRAAIFALNKLKLGQSHRTDFLAVSFSTHDIAGHRFGPNSPENEELILHEDFLLSELLNEVNARVPGGLKNVLISLTADHGVAPTEKFAKSFGIDAGTIDQAELVRRFNLALETKFGAASGGPWISGVRSFNLYFSAKNFKKLSEQKTEIYTFAKTWLLEQPGVAFVFSGYDDERGILPPAMLGRQISKSYVPGVSGDLILVPKSNWYELSKNTAIHMTGYSYDRVVPLILMGPHVKGGVYSTPAHVVDLAPTLSFLLGQVAPSLSEGRILNEILKN